MMTKDGYPKWRGSETFKKNYVGLPLFLCGGGPSLSKIDPQRIKGPGRVVMCMNRTYPYITPDIWIGMDKPENYTYDLLYQPFMKILRGTYHNLKFNGTTLSDFYNTHFLSFSSNGESDDADCSAMDKKFRWHKNTFRTAIDVALWMGFKHIFLFGVDFDNRSKDYFDGTVLTPQQREYNRKLYDQQFKDIDTIVEQIEKKNGKLFSCSDGSKINEKITYFHYLDIIDKIEGKIPKNKSINHVLEGT
jgi:hypothetical protein